MRKANIAVAVLCILLSVYVIVTAQGFPENLSAVDPGPAYFPSLMAGMVIILSLILAGLAIAGKGKDTEDKLDFHDGSKRALAGIAMMAVYCMLLKPLGFIIDTIWLCFAMMILLQNRKYPVIAVVSVITAAVVYVIFAMVLGAKLPAGLLKGIL